MKKINKKYAVQKIGTNLKHLHYTSNILAQVTNASDLFEKLFLGGYDYHGIVQLEVKYVAVVIQTYTMNSCVLYTEERKLLMRRYSLYREVKYFCSYTSLASSASSLEAMWTEPDGTIKLRETPSVHNDRGKSCRSFMNS